MLFYIDSGNFTLNASLYTEEARVAAWERWTWVLLSQKIMHSVYNKTKNYSASFGLNLAATQGQRYMGDIPQFEHHI